MKHTIEGIVKNYKNFKYCLRCGVINWHKNKKCRDCGNEEFDPMDKEDVEDLIEDWKDEMNFVIDT